MHLSKASSALIHFLLRRSMMASSRRPCPASCRSGWPTGSGRSCCRGSGSARRRCRPGSRAPRSALLVDAFEEVLRDDELEAGRQGVADLTLLLGREDLDDAVHGLGRADGVQGAEDKMARGGGFDGQSVWSPGRAFLADQDDVRVLAQRALERGPEGPGMPPDLAVVDEAALLLWTNSMGSSTVMMWS